MKTKRVYLFVIVGLLLIGMSACTRSIAGGTKATKAPEGTAEALPTDATDVLSQIYIFATQTALATQGLITPAAPIGQETPAAPEVTPAAPATEPVMAATPTQPAQVVEPVALATAPPLVVPTTYTLQKGEFPFCIARRFNLDPGELLRLNGLSSYSVYYAGMVLRIPQTGRGFPGGRALLPHPTSYTVRAGDTIHTIACAFGDVDPNAIAVVNNLQPPYRLTPGQVLQIP